jgi:hypothetical protein
MAVMAGASIFMRPAQAQRPVGDAQAYVTGIFERGLRHGA